MVFACSEECGCTFWRGPKLSNEMKLEAGHKPCHLPCGGGLVSPIGDETTVGFASRTSGARPKWRECAENHAASVSVLSRKRAGEPGPSLCRKNGLDLPIGHIKGYRLASKNPGTRSVFGRARPKTGLRVAVGSS